VSFEIVLIHSAAVVMPGRMSAIRAGVDRLALHTREIGRHVTIAPGLTHGRFREKLPSPRTWFVFRPCAGFRTPE
jgi:hypothetical protein